MYLFLLGITHQCGRKAAAYHEFALDVGVSYRLAVLPGERRKKEIPASDGQFHGVRPEDTVMYRLRISSNGCCQARLNEERGRLPAAVHAEETPQKVIRALPGFAYGVGGGGDGSGGVGSSAHGRVEAKRVLGRACAPTRPQARGTDILGLLPAQGGHRPCDAGPAGIKRS